MLWADRRAAAEAVEIENLVDWERFYQITGGGLEIALYPIAKQLWMKRHEPDLYRDAVAFLGTKDVIVAWLTGRAVTDPSEASNTGLLDVVTRRWSSELTGEVGLDLGKLPEIVASTSLVGYTRKDAAEASGLQPGTPILAGAGDVVCSAVGAGAVHEGAAYNYIGSASWVAVSSHSPLRAPTLHPFVLCHAVPGMYVSQLATYSAGVVLEWVRDQLCPLERAAAECMGGNAFDLITRQAERSSPGANGLTFLPFLRPGGAPSYDLADCGVLYGLSLSHTRADILRAILEGITCSIRQLLDGLEGCLGRPVPQLRLVGGGAKSPFWVSLVADMVCRRVQTLDVRQQVTTVGAAIIAAVGTGQYVDFEAAAGAFVHPDVLREPDADSSASCACVYSRFIALSTAMRRFHNYDVRT
jgi:xylulokinase